MEAGHNNTTFSKLHRFATQRNYRAFTRGWYKERKKGVIYNSIPAYGVVIYSQHPIPLEQEHILVRNNTMLELKQYCRDNQLKGFSKHTSKQKISGFIMKQNF